jgi:L,D-transpeptidase catalytic domain
MSLARPIAALLMLAIAGCAGHASPKSPTTTMPATTSAAPKKHAPAAFVIPAGSGHLAAMARGTGFTLRDQPRGRVIAHLEPKTAWGSPTVVWAVTQRGPWLGVVATRLHNNQIGWLDVRHDRPLLWRTPYSLDASLSQRTLVLRRGNHVVRTMSIGVGAAGTPTPTGRFTITDKLIPDRALSYYGCCLLALSGHQSHLRPGWAGGDRIAIHGGSVGGAASAGCLHVGEADLKYLMRRLALGTPVVIRS